MTFDELYLPLLRLCALLTGARESAEDIVQEAFVRVASRIEAVPPDETAAYLRRVVVNLWRNHRRRLALERRPYPRAPEIPSPSPNVDDSMWQQIRRLPERQRACVVLRFYEDLSERDVAEILHVSVGTVKSQTSRALAKLREELGDEA